MSGRNWSHVHGNLLKFRGFYFRTNCVGWKTLILMLWILQSSEVKYATKSLFILLLYFWNSDMGKVFMKANKKYQIQNLMSIRKIAERLNRVIVKDILFINAWSGCGSTSALFNKGKTALIKLIAKGDREVRAIYFIFDKTYTFHISVKWNMKGICVYVSAVHDM